MAALGLTAAFRVQGKKSDLKRPMQLTPGHPQPLFSCSLACRMGRVTFCRGGGCVWGERPGFLWACGFAALSVDGTCGFLEGGGGRWW